MTDHPGTDTPAAPRRLLVCGCCHLGGFPFATRLSQTGQELATRRRRDRTPASAHGRHSGVSPAREAPAATPGVRGYSPPPPPVSPIRGLIDFHTHAAPDVFGRAVDDDELASQAAARQMEAVVFKNHVALTADRVDLTAHRMTFETLKKRKRGVFRAVPLPPEFAVMLDHVHDLRRSQRRKDRRPTRAHVGVVAGDGLAQRRIKSTSPEKACLVRYNTERNVRPNPWGSRAAPVPESALPPSTARYAPLARQSPSPALPAGAGRLPCPSDRR